MQNEQPPSLTPQLPTIEPPKRRPRKLIVASAVAAVLIVSGMAAWTLTGHKSNNTEPSTSNKAAKNPAAQTSASKNIRLIATGDFIAHDSLNQNAKSSDGSYNYLQFMSDFKPVFAAADIRFCNQATVSGGEAYGISGYPIFNAPTQFAKDMGSLGCNLINAASNHSFDKGQAPITSTLDTWDKVPNLLAVSGENRSQKEQAAIKYFTVKGVKMAFLAYTTYTNSPPGNSYGVNVYSDDFAKTQIQAARQAGAKFIVASMRWGTEYSSTVNPAQTKQSQFLADQGVNLILGHGPHQLQTVKELTGAGGNKTLVWYSLGNFINTQEPPETLFNGLANMEIDPSSLKVTKVSYLPIYMHYEWTAAQAATEDLLARKNLHLYLLENANQSLIDSNQLKTTVAQQKQRIQGILNQTMTVPLLTTSQYYQ